MKNFISKLLILTVLNLMFFDVEAQEIAKPTVITFGSCGHEAKDQPIIQKVADQHPDFFIYLGDNIYGDTYDMDLLRSKYRQLGEKLSYQSLRRSTKILATWDDHDYGWNDIGRHYSKKEDSKDIFLDFFEEPKTSIRYQRAGIYDAHLYNIGDNVLQIILLDTRTFRDDLRNYRGELHHDSQYFYALDYYPHQNPDSTILGQAQWKWLEEELRKPADVRIIASSTQFGIAFNGYEAWANFPHEQQKMINLIRETKANGVLFISGDVHYSEISKILAPDLYPLYDFTSSGITSTWHFATPNKNRIEGPVMENHYGKITINWDRRDPEIKMETIDIHDNQRIELTLKLSALSHF